VSVIVYSTNHCPECNILKRFLHDYNVDFEVRNCSADPSYWKEIEDLGFLGVPVTVVNGKAIQGFKPEEIMNACKQGDK
jgi:glutaredoxin-like protein NrdH